MASKQMTMTEGPLARQIMAFSIPLMISNVLQVLFNMADIAVAGRFAGPEALGAVGSTTILVTLFIGIVIGMGTGVNVTVARFLGARQERDVRESVHTSLILCLLIGLALAAVGVGGTHAIMTAMHTKPELIDGAERYLHIYFLGMPALGVYNFGNAVLSADGDTRHPLLFLSAAGVLNVVLNIIFVVVCQLGVAGVAIASVVSQYLSAALILRFMMHSDSITNVRLDELRLTGSKVRMILPLGMFSGAQNAIFQLANLFVQTGVNSFDAVMVEGNAAAANADGLVYDVMAAFYTACSSFMSQNYGAGKKERVLKSYYISLAYSFGVGLAIGVALVALGPQFLSLFTTDPQVAQKGMVRLTIMGLSYGFSAFMDCTIAASRGLGRSVVPTILVILGSCVFRLIWIFTVFAHFQTIMSLYLLYIFSWTITAIAEIAYFVPCYRKQMALLK